MINYDEMSEEALEQMWDEEQIEKAINGEL
mgnify:CR=1 FL=1